jgi:hypothetical protein
MDRDFTVKPTLADQTSAIDLSSAFPAKNAAKKTKASNKKAAS